MGPYTITEAIGIIAGTICALAGYTVMMGVCYRLLFDFCAREDWSDERSYATLGAIVWPAILVIGAVVKLIRFGDSIPDRISRYRAGKKLARATAYERTKRDPSDWLDGGQKYDHHDH